jgi:predicted Fe-Mo cluster-binding NifX family protein
MKIAIPVSNENQIDTHFGHCESYGINIISGTNEISDLKNVQSSHGCGFKFE